MDLTGPIRIATALGLVFSMAAFNSMTASGNEEVQAADTPASVCDSSNGDSANTPGFCNRTMNGGASFVSVGG